MGERIEKDELLEQRNGMYLVLLAVTVCFWPSPPWRRLHLGGYE